MRKKTKIPKFEFEKQRAKVLKQDLSTIYLYAYLSSF